MIDPLQAVLTIAFGALAGGVTNALAIWMLFHPRRPVRLFGRPVPFLHGAIPKNQARLARAMGSMVATQLLTPRDLERMLTEPDFRGAFQERLAAAIRDVLETPRPSLREMLPATAETEVEALLRSAAAGAHDRLDTYLAGAEFRETARRWAATLAEEIGQRPVHEWLTPEREQRLAAGVESWLAETVAGPGFDAAVRESVDRAADRVLVSDRTFQDVLPQGLVAAAERAIASYLPLLLERLGRLLEEPAARDRVRRTLHEIIDRFMENLRIHQRIVAALVITPDMVNRVLRVIEEEGADRIAELLHEPDVREAMARGVNDAVVEFLGRPVTDVLGEPGEEGVEEAKRAIGDAVLRLARDDAAHEFLVEKLRGALGAAEQKTWGDLIGRTPPERVADALVEVARDERAGEIYEQAFDRLVGGVLDTPIGRPADYLPADAADRIEKSMAEPLWLWMVEQVPHVASRIDIAGRVEQKVLEFPPERVEELIRRITEKELMMIVRLGYVLGAIVGCTLLGVTALLG